MDKALLLEKTTHELAGVQSFPELAKKAVKLITNEMVDKNITGASIYKVDYSQKKVIAHSYATRFKGADAAISSANFSKLSTPLSNSSNLIVRTVVTGKVQQSADFADFSADVVPKAVALGIQKVTKAKIGITFPITAKGGKVTGVIMFALTTSHIDPAEFELLETFSQQLGLAFANVFAFEKLMETYKRDLAKLETAPSEEDIPSIKFTLRITPKENKRLEEMASENKKTKAEVIRDLIDEA